MMFVSVLSFGTVVTLQNSTYMRLWFPCAPQICCEETFLLYKPLQNEWPVPRCSCATRKFKIRRGMRFCNPLTQIQVSSSSCEVKCIVMNGNSNWMKPFHSLQISRSCSGVHQANIDFQRMIGMQPLKNLQCILGIAACDSFICVQCDLESICAHPLEHLKVPTSCCIARQVSELRSLEWWSVCHIVLKDS